MRYLALLALIPALAFGADSTVTSNSTVNSKTTMDYTGQPPQRAFAPTLSPSSNNTLCIVPVTGGVQTSIIGVSGGSYVIDEVCQLIALSRELRANKLTVSSTAVLCSHPIVFKALLNAGSPCPYSGKIGKEAMDIYNKYPQLRSDYQDYLMRKEMLITDGVLDNSGNLIDKKDVKTNSNTPFKSSTHDWNE